MKSAHASQEAGCPGQTAGSVSGPMTDQHAGQQADPVSGLVQAALDGDEDAWAALVDKFTPLVWSVCRSCRLPPEDAADIYQVTWLRLLENLDRVRDPRRLPGWIATTCRRECLALIARTRTSVTMDSEELDRQLDGDPPADGPLLAAEQHAALWRAFGRLSDWCQQILRALVINVPDDKRPSYQQAARDLGTPQGSLGPTRRRCLNQLRELADNEGI
jgi:RNA polymerase sigma factor (sigma-70 family)